MFFFAGHDTVAVSVAWAFWELAVQPDVQRKLQNEIDPLFQERSSSKKLPSYQQISQLKYLDSVVRETLRMHAPAIVGRTPTEDVTLYRGNDTTYVIPAGTSVYVIPCYTQVQKAFIQNEPTKFRPERFMDPAEETETMKSYLPFSVGPRNCVGLPMALAEFKSILCHILRHYSIHPSPNQTSPPMPISMLTIKPHQVLVDLERRM